MKFLKKVSFLHGTFEYPDLGAPVKTISKRVFFKRGVLPSRQESKNGVRKKGDEDEQYQP